MGEIIPPRIDLTPELVEEWRQQCRVYFGLIAELRRKITAANILLGQTPTVSRGRGNATVSPLVLQHLRAAYPDGMKVSKLRPLVEADSGQTYHPKTMGMTLYRLQQQGTVRREGRMWFAPPHV